MNTARLIQALIDTYIDGCRTADAECFMNEPFRATFVDCCSQAVKVGVMALDVSATANIAAIEHDIRKAVSKAISIR